MAVIETDNLISSGTAAKSKSQYPQIFQQWVKRGITPKPILIDGFMYFDKNEIAQWKPPVVHKRANTRKKRC